MNNVASYQYQTLQVSVQHGILTLSLNRPDKKNAMSFAMMRELILVAKRVSADKHIRAVIVDGSEHTFCSGIDLQDLNAPKNQAFAIWELIKPWQSLFQKVCLVWQDLPVPVIGVLEGHCLGAGLQLALAFDSRISHPDCKFAIMEAKWGLVPDMGLSQSAVGIVRLDVLKELAMSARVIDSSTALKAGLISHCHEDPMAAALALAEEIIARSPDAVLASKRVVNQLYSPNPISLYQEKLWQLKLMLGRNQKLAVKKAKEASVKFTPRQFR